VSGPSLDDYASDSPAGLRLALATSRRFTEQARAERDAALARAERAEAELADVVYVAEKARTWLTEHRKFGSAADSKLFMKFANALDALPAHAAVEQQAVSRNADRDYWKLRAEKAEAVVEAAKALVECERLLIAQKRMLGEKYTTCDHQTALVAAVDALNRDGGDET